MSTFWLNGEGPPSNETNHPGNSPSSSIRNMAGSASDSALSAEGNIAIPETARPIVTVNGAHVLPPIINSAVTNMPEASGLPPVGVGQKRKSSILGSLGFWRPYSATYGDDVGVFPA